MGWVAIGSNGRCGLVHQQQFGLDGQRAPNPFPARCGDSLLFSLHQLQNITASRSRVVKHRRLRKRRAVRRLPLGGDHVDASHRVDPVVAQRVRRAHTRTTCGCVRCAARDEQLPSGDAPRFAPTRFSHPHCLLDGYIEHQGSGDRFSRMLLEARCQTLPESDCFHSSTTAPAVVVVHELRAISAGD